LRFKKQNAGVTSEQIRAFEEIIRYRLPSDYRTFILEFNGGWSPTPSQFTYTVWDCPQGVSSIHHLWGVGDDGLRIVNGDYLEIGIDPFGNKFLLCLKPELFGHVYYWETDWDFQLPGEEYPSVDHLADSFTEFLDILTEETTMQVPEVRSQGRPVIMAPGATLNAVYHPPTLSDMPAFAGGMFYDQHGFADFTPYSEVNVHIAATESILENVQQANAAVGFEDTPEGYVWHHHQDGRTMMLLPIPIKIAAPHTSGLPIIRASRERQK
jgi:hypothetical protein